MYHFISYHIIKTVYHIILCSLSYYLLHCYISITLYIIFSIIYCIILLYCIIVSISHHITLHYTICPLISYRLISHHITSYHTILNISYIYICIIWYIIIIWWHMASRSLHVQHLMSKNNPTSSAPQKIPTSQLAARWGHLSFLKRKKQRDKGQKSETKTKQRQQ